MKRYCKNFKFTKENITKNIFNCLDKNRWKRKDTSYFLAGYAIQFDFMNGDINDVAKRIRIIATHNRSDLFPLIDKISDSILSEINSRTITLPGIMYQMRKDNGSGKEREIGISSIKQQVYDYIAVDACKDMFMAKIGFYQCASIPKRGQLFGKKSIERWLRSDPIGTKYIFECDVKKYYPSVNKRVIKRLLSRDIKNDDILYILYTLIDTYKSGLCIGSYLCQYLANYLLSYLYHAITEKCYFVRRKIRHNWVKHMIIYMDNIMLFSNSKKYLSLAARYCEEFLNNVLDLELNINKRIFPTNDKFIDSMGFKISKTHTTIRKRNYKRIRRMFKRYKNRLRHMTVSAARRITSYYGFIKHTDSYRCSHKHKSIRTLKTAKGVIKCEDISKKNSIKSSIIST